MEKTKILRKRKIVGIFAGLLALQIFLFMYLSQDEGVQENFNEIVLQEEDSQEDDYAKSFHESIEIIVNRADYMSSISIFGDENSFSNRNLKKTKEDYEKLLDVNPIEFDGIFLSEFLENKTVNLLLAICAILTVTCLVDENKKGLRSMIFASVNGRGKLMVQKFFALLFWDVVLVAAFCGTTLFASTIRYQGHIIACLDYPVQSLEILSKLPWVVNIGEFLLIYFAYRCMALLFIMMAAWAAMYCIDNLLLSLGILSGIGIAEYLSCVYISTSSPLAVLHYCNIWYLMEDASLFTEYKNLNIFVMAVNKNIVIAFCWLVMMLIMLVAVITIGCRRYPNSSRGIIRINNMVQKLGMQLMNIRAGCLEKMSLTGAEYYKLLISQKGIWIMTALVVVLIWQTDFTEVTFTGGQELYYDFLEKYGGVPSEESAEYLKNLSEETSQVTIDYEQALEQYMADTIVFDDYYVCYMRYNAYGAERNFLSMIESQTNYLQELKETKGINGWYINIYTYGNLIGGSDSLVDIVLILCIVLLCSGIFAKEKECGISPVMRAAEKGRDGMFWRKIHMALWMSGVLYLIYTGLTVASVTYAYGLEFPKAPVQSLETLTFVPFSCSIGVFLAGLYVLRGIILLVMAVFTCVLSIWVKQGTAVALSFVLCVPSLLSLIGFDFLKNVSIIRVLSIAPLLVQVQNIWIVLGLSAGFVLLGIGFLRSGYWKWCVS